MPRFFVWNKEVPMEATSGRAICLDKGHEGQRWLPVVFFYAKTLNAAGEPMRISSSCRTCQLRYKRTRKDTLRDQHAAHRRGDYVPNASRREIAPSGPFLTWLRNWEQRQRLERGPRQFGKPGGGVEDLASLAGISSRAIRYAREHGRVSVALVDKVLIAAGGDTMLWELYDLETLAPVDGVLEAA